MRRQDPDRGAVTGKRDDRAAVRRLEHRAVEHLGRSARTRPAVDSGRARGPRQAPARGRASRSAARGPPPASSASSRSSSSALGWSTPENGSSSSSTGASWTSARATSTRWRWPPESSPNERSARSARPTRSSASSAKRRSARRTGAPPRHARERPHERDVERGHRVVEPRALGLRDVPVRAGTGDRPANRRQLTEQHPEERRLAAAVRAEHADPLARAQLEGDPVEHRRAAVTGGEAPDSEERPGRGQRRPPSAQRTRPPVKPRAIASAFARSMPR